MSDDLHVHQCPYCELHFRFVNEVKDHVVRDHRDHAAAFEHMEPSERRAPGHDGGHTAD
jgi:hypothetical protein